MNYKFKWRSSDVHVIFEGDIYFNDINQSGNRIYGDSRFDLMRYAIFDFYNVKSFNLTTDEVEIISELDISASNWNRRLKLACIANDNFTNEKLLLYVKLMKDNNWNTKLFNNLKEAIEWCNE